MATRTRFVAVAAVSIWAMMHTVLRLQYADARAIMLTSPGRDTRCRMPACMPRRAALPRAARRTYALCPCLVPMHCAHALCPSLCPSLCPCPPTPVPVPCQMASLSRELQRSFEQALRQVVLCLPAVPACQGWG